MFEKIRKTCALFIFHIWIDLNLNKQNKFSEQKLTRIVLFCFSRLNNWLIVLEKIFKAGF